MAVPRHSPGSGRGAPLWRFAALPLVAVAVTLWFTRSYERPLDACLDAWQLDRREDRMIDVVEAAGRPVALSCLSHDRSVSFIGVVLAEMPAAGALPEREVAEVREAGPPGLDLDDAGAARLIDAAIEARYGCRIREDTPALLPPVASRLPVIERIAVPLEALDCRSALPGPLFAAAPRHAA